MSERKPESDLDALDARLRHARGEAATDAGAGPAGGESPGSSRSALGLAFRVGVELVSALAIGVGIGWLLDSWLGTRPWLMLVFILLGGAAGILNVYRVARGFGYAVGYQKGNEPGDRPPGDRGSGIEG